MITRNDPCWCGSGQKWKKCHYPRIPTGPSLAKQYLIDYGIVLKTPEQISKKIAELLHSEEINANVEIIYQSIEGLHSACPNNTGDWYFTGNYPTPGGNKVVNKSFINYMEGENVRAY